MSEREYQHRHIELLEREVLALEGILTIMASLDTDVQTATTLLNELVTALQAAEGTASPVPAADQTALETAIAAAQAALPTTTTAPVASDPVATVPAGSSDAQVPTVPEAPVSSPEVS